MRNLPFAISLLAIAACAPDAHEAQESSGAAATGDTASMTQRSDGHFGVEVFAEDGCAGTARWLVGSDPGCDASNRPDFYARSTRSRGVCRTFGYREEDQACHEAFALTYGVEVFADEGCAGTAPWLVGSDPGCDASNRPDFYARSTRSRGVCRTFGYREEDQACHEAFAFADGVEVFAEEGCAGTARWLVGSDPGCDASNRPDFYARSTRNRGVCRTFSYREEDQACHEAFAFADGVEVFAEEGCAGTAPWLVGSDPGCDASNRPDFYARSTRSRGVCRTFSYREEDQACHEAFALIDGVAVFAEEGCAGTARWLVGSDAGCDASTRPDFYARSTRIHDHCRTFSYREEDQACHEAFALGVR